MRKKKVIMNYDYDIFVVQSLMPVCMHCSQNHFVSVSTVCIVVLKRFSVFQRWSNLDLVGSRFVSVLVDLQC